MYGNSNERIKTKEPTRIGLTLTPDTGIKFDYQNFITVYPLLIQYIYPHPHHHLVFQLKPNYYCHTTFVLMDPLATIKTIISVARTIMSIVKEVRENNEESKAFGERVCHLLCILEHYEGATRSTINPDMLRAVKELLDDATNFLSRFVSLCGCSFHHQKRSEQKSDCEQIYKFKQ
jgi:hypothetical protein